MENKRSVGFKTQKGFRKEDYCAAFAAAIASS
jgi:hypothetical protein